MTISILLEKLESELPEGVPFKIYYLSTPPISVSPIYSKYPGQQFDSKTFCTKHFLVVAINIPPSDKDQKEKEEDGAAARKNVVIVYALEVLIYSTVHDITIFVSKADSTGYLDLLKLPKLRIPSPIGTISTTFIQYLVEKYQQPNHKIIISLFARAQDQYLFPRSVEYAGKHVQHDSGLIRWWCRVLNPILQSSQVAEKTGSLCGKSTGAGGKGYLIIPGLDAHETLSYIPNRLDNLWKVGHPLQEISQFKGKNVAPRYLIPRFPDDPKARFLDELDEEILKCDTSNRGQWKSIQTLDQFWEMMAFRQECSAGRLVGFIWIVISSAPLPRQEDDIQDKSTNSNKLDIVLNNQSNNPLLCYHTSSPASRINQPHSERKSIISSTASCPDQNSETNSSTSLRLSPPPLQINQQKKKKKEKKLTGKIIPRQPRFKIDYSLSSSSNDTGNELSLKQNQKSKFQKSLTNSTNNRIAKNEKTTLPGQILVADADYQRIMGLLLHLDFSKLELALSSSKRWIDESCCAATSTSYPQKEFWGQLIIGKKKECVINTDNCNNKSLDGIGSGTVKPLMVLKRLRKVAASSH